MPYVISVKPAQERDNFTQNTSHCPATMKDMAAKDMAARSRNVAINKFNSAGLARFASKTLVRALLSQATRCFSDTKHHVLTTLRISACLGPALLVASLLACREPTIDAANAADAGAPAFDGADSSPADASAPALRIATINLRCQLEDWPARLPLLVEELAALRPDLVTLQEVCREEGGRDALIDLSNALNTATADTYVYKRAETHFAWNRYHEGIALLSRHPLVSSEVITLPPGVFPRKAVVATIETPVFHLQVAATHLSFGNQAGVRKQQLSAVRSALQARRQGRESLIFAGDLNEKPSGEAIAESAAASYQDIWRLLHSTISGPTFPANSPRARIDYIFLLPGEDGLHATQVKRFLQQPTNQRYPSDHLGVWADLQL